MATPFRDIYCLNKLIKNDPRLKKLSEEQFSMLSYGYLKFAISYFMYDCRKDLTKYIPPTCQMYTFTGDGKEAEFLLSPSPYRGSEYLVWSTVDGVTSPLTNFKVEKRKHEEPEPTPNPNPGDKTDSQDDGSIPSIPLEPANPTGPEIPAIPIIPATPIYDFVLVLDNIPLEGETVTVSAFTYGEFEEDLDNREKVILAEAMNIPYIEEAKNDQNAMKYIVSGKSLRFFSQANHIGATIESYNSQAYNIVDALISEYSYKGDPDEYIGLARRGRGGSA